MDRKGLQQSPLEAALQEAESASYGLPDTLKKKFEQDRINAEARRTDVNQQFDARVLDLNSQRAATSGGANWDRKLQGSTSFIQSNPDVFAGYSPEQMHWIAAISAQESAGNPNARSPVGAMGFMQVMPDTGAKPGYGIKPLRDGSVRENVRLGMGKFEAMMSRYNGDVDKALAAYNAGEGNVDKAVRRSRENGGDWKAYLPRPQETIPYINNVKSYYSAIGSGKNIPSNGAQPQQAQQTRTAAQDDARYRPLSETEIARMQEAQSQGLTEFVPFMGAKPIKIGQQPTQAQPQNEDAGFWSDTGNLLLSGINSSAEAAREISSRIPGVRNLVGAVDKIDQYFTGKTSQQLFDEARQKYEGKFTPETAEARKKLWVVEPGDKLSDGTTAQNWDLGEAWKDPRAYYAGITESVPEMVMSMGGSLALAKGVFKRALASGATREVAAKKAATTATIAGGLIEGSLGGGHAAVDVRKEINSMSADMLKNSDAMKTLMSEGKTFEEARSQLADDAATKAFVVAGVGTGIFGGMGDRAIANIITKGTSSRLKSAAAGAVAEGIFEEMPQSALQQVGQNYAVQDADPNRSLMKGVANQAAGGAVLGGIMGGGIGAATHRAEVAQTGQPAEDVPQAGTDAPIETPTQGIAPEQPIQTEQQPPRNVGPIERALGGEEGLNAAIDSEIAAVAAEQWLGAPGTVTQISPKADPETTYTVTVEGYENGEVFARDQDGTPMQFGQDDVNVASPATDITTVEQANDVQTADGSQSNDQGLSDRAIQENASPAATQADGTPASEAAQSADLTDFGYTPTQPEKAAEDPNLSTFDTTEGQSVDTPPVTKVEIEPADKTLGKMSDSELRARMKYLADQARLNGGWDKRLMSERRKVEVAINKLAKKQAEVVETPQEAPAVEQVDATLTDEGTTTPSNFKDLILDAHVNNPAKKAQIITNEIKASGRKRSDVFAEVSKIVGEYEATKQAAEVQPVEQAAEATTEAPKPLMGADGKPKWFFSRDKAESFITKKKLGNDYQVNEVSKNRFEIHPIAEAAPSNAAPSVAETTTSDNKGSTQNLKGKDIGDGWSEFSDQSGTIGIPRAEMPQIKAEHRGAMVNFMNARGIAHQEETVAADSLKPTQAEFSQEKVDKAKNYEGGNRSILISSDNHVLDGHHQWMAAREAGEDVKVIRLNAPIRDLITIANEFPSSTTSEGSAEKEAKPAEKAMPSENTLVTDDRAAELRARLKAKLSQLNSGIDPEILAIGAELAVYHIERGARTFAAFAKNVAADLDVTVDKLRPYLRGWYNGARDMMEDMGGSIEGMDSADTVRAELAKIDQGEANVPSTEQRVEQDSGDTEARESVIPNTDDNATGQNAQSVEQTSGRTDGEQRARQRDQRVPGDSAATGGKQSDQRVHREDGQFEPTERPARSAERSGSGVDSSQGQNVERERAKSIVADASASRTDELSQRLKAQKQADKTPTKWGDKASIDAALPLLLPEQREDVLKAETRLADNNGILFTNGTGTGKTATGLGIVKRFINDGKDNVIVVVPSDKIASDWVKFAKMLNIELKQLDGIEDNGGTGPVVTTYANFGQNDTLAQRDWDLVVPDESHYLSSNEAGDSTAALSQLRGLTGHHRGFYDWVRRRHHKEWKSWEDARAAVADLKENDKKYPKLKAAEEAAGKKWRDIESRERDKWEGRWETQKDLPKTTFLSATPFAYVKNTDYAEGYLFHYVEPSSLKESQGQGGGYNSGSPRDRFMMERFGYRMRYNKLTAPESGVNSQLLEQQFNEHLKKEGALSGRKLEVPFDYDRKFVLVDDAVGTKIDNALKYLREQSLEAEKRARDENGDQAAMTEAEHWRNLFNVIDKAFDYQSRMYLLESIKAKAAVPMIRDYLKSGRKVVVFHDYNQGGGFDPFTPAMGAALAPGQREFNQRVLSSRPDLFKLDLKDLRSATETLTEAFPNAMLFNGTVSKANRRANADKFNDDKVKDALIIVQSDAGREGVSLHDTSGKFQRVEINLGMPVKPVAATQIEGRTYRTGQASDAMFRYLTTGTGWEASAFASKIAERASTAENLALGSEARGLKDAFIDAYQSAASHTLSESDGKGGKDYDRKMSASNTVTPFDKAKTFYWAQQKNSKKRDQREGMDYFATPEPVGFKMVEWANVKPGDKALEPSAGHGAIARFFPEQADVTMIEPSYDLSQRAGLANGNARIINDIFENLHINNKYDAIVMNPPYGNGGKISTEHIAKAATHLRDGGRIVALIPRGGMADNRLQQFLSSDAAADLYVVAKVKMPPSTFERAGTSVNTQVLILEKHKNKDDAAGIIERDVDLSDAKSVNELFDGIEQVSMPDRKPSTTPEPKLEIVDYTSPSGRVVRGTILTGMVKADAQQIDPYTFRMKNEDGKQGWFIRETFFKYLPDELKFSRNDAQAVGMSVNDVRVALNDRFGAETVAKLEKAGTLTIVDTFDVPGVEGYSQNGKATLVANALTPETIVPVFLHELGGHVGMQGVMKPTAYKNLMDQFDRLVAAQDPIALEAKRLAEREADPNARQDEYLPYLITAAARAQNKRPGVRTLVNRIVSAVKAWAVDKLGLNLNLNASDVLALAERMVQTISQRSVKKPETYGEIMRPLDIDALGLTDDHRKDPLVQRFIKVSDAVKRAEKISDPDTWTAEQKEAYEQSDYKRFSELRGYTPAEIRQFGDFMDLYEKVDAKYGEDTAVSIDYLMSEQTAPIEDADQLYSREDQTNSEAFKRWFGDSKVVDASGKPLVVYHGSPDVRGIFAEGFKPFSRGHVFFAAKDSDVANSYADDSRAFDYQNAEPHVIPLYLSIKNPMIIDAKGQNWKGTEKFVDEAKEKGHDGIIINNSVDYYNNSRGSKATTVYAWFEPTQAKSAVEGNLRSRIDGISIKGATGNNGAFDPNNPDIRFSRRDDDLGPVSEDEYASKLNQWSDTLKNLPSDSLTNAMQKGLGLIPLRPMLNEMAKDIPAASVYLRIKDAMDTMRNKWHAKTDAVAQQWLKYRIKNKEENRELMDLMHESTLMQVDPSKDFESILSTRDKVALAELPLEHPSRKQLEEKQDRDEARKAAHAAMQPRFAQLSSEAKAIYENVRDTYTDLADAFDKTLLENMEKAINVRIKKADRDHKREMERITDEGLKGQEREDAIAAAERRLKNAKTKIAWNRKARMTQLRQQFETQRLQGPYFPLARFGNFFVTVRDKKSGEIVSFSRFEKADQQRRFFEDVSKDPDVKVEQGALSDASVVRKEVDPNFVADVEDILADLPNAEQVKDEVWQRYLESLPDMSVRKARIHRKGREGYTADAVRAFGSHMFHGSHQLARMAHSMDLADALEEARDQARETKNPTRSGLIVNEMDKRHQFVMSPTGGALAQWASSFAFVWYLAGSPKAAIMNLFQTPIMGVPILGAYAGGLNGIARAGKELTNALVDFTKGKGFAERSARLTADERRAMSDGYETGVIERTQGHDLAGVGETGVEYSAARERAMKIISWGFHHAERLNREVTFLAAYRIARSKGLGHEAAVTKAGDLTWKAHFDYSNTSRPRLMHNDTMKILLVFRNFQINMLYRLFRDTHQALNGETKEVKKEAFTHLAGITGMMMLNAGITGTWLFGIAMVMAGMFADDGEDPDEELKKAMVNAIGPKLAGLALHGVPGYVTGTSLSASVGMADLWFRSPDSEKEGEEALQYWQSQLLGAVPGIGAQFVRGWSQIKKGEEWRGIETMMPKMFKDPMKAYRFMTEGATNMRGDTVTDVNMSDVIKQALGFSPARIAEQYKINNASYNLQQSINKQHTILVNDIRKAQEAGDVEAEDRAWAKAHKFSEKYPEKRITPKKVNASKKREATASENAVGGMRFNKTTRERILEGQSPAIYSE